MSAYITDLVTAESVADSDYLVIENGSGTQKIPIGELLKANNLDLNLSDSYPFNLVAGLHNRIPGHETVSWTDAEFRARLRGTSGYKVMEGIYPGVVVHRPNADYLIAHVNYFSNCNGITVPHVVMVPVGCLDTSKQMNSSATTSGGYKGTAMRSSNMATARSKITADFGSDYILAHSEILSNAQDGWEWVSGCTIELMNEAMVYGCKHFGYMGYGGGTGRSQLAVFQLFPEKQIVTASWYWLRDISVSSPSGRFCLVYGNGGAGADSASAAGGVRPYFVFY